MKIIYDSREKPQAIEKILAEFDRQGVEYERKKLDVGDYVLDGQPNLVIDRKQNLSELARNLFSPDDRGRFWREIKRSKQQSIKLIVLVEHSKNIRSIQDVSNWSNHFGSVSGRDLAERIYKVHISWGVEFMFCSKDETGKRIIEILGGNQSGRT